jgi:hypothetical protein
VRSMQTCFPVVCARWLSMAPWTSSATPQAMVTRAPPRPWTPAKTCHAG